MRKSGRTFRVLLRAIHDASNAKAGDIIFVVAGQICPMYANQLASKARDIVNIYGAKVNNVTPNSFQIERAGSLKFITMAQRTRLIATDGFRGFGAFSEHFDSSSESYIHHD